MENKLSIVILAVTKTFGSYCIAGMDNKGNWYRPLPDFGGKFWPLVYYSDETFIQVGDVWEISNYEEELDLSSPGHTEDIRLKSPAVCTKRLSNNELIHFVQQHQENYLDLQATLNADGRSLCLVSAEQFNGFVHTNSYNGRNSARATFQHEGNRYSNTTSAPGFPLTDLKWRSYILQQQDIPTEWESVFICVGLARTEPNKNIAKEYPMIISIITSPGLPLLQSYPS